MEEQNKLNLEIGNIEIERESLKPKKVKIVDVKLQTIDKAKSEKICCLVKHPDKEEEFTLSGVAYLQDKAVVNRGLWFNTDKENNLQKGSALAVFLEYVGCKTIKELEGKEVETDLDGKYLCFKAY